MTALPFVDEHAVVVAVPRERAWAAVRDVAGRLSTGGSGLVRRVLGTDPPAGFGVAEATAPARLELAGRHRFSEYRLAFELDEAGEGATRVRARTYAAFPGPPGRVYRALVIGTRLHVVATRGILGAIRRRATAPPPVAGA
jgi:hypothetical protein